MNILVADDHNLFADALSHLLDAHPEVATIYKSSDYASTIRVLSSTNDINLLLLDLRMPGMEIPTGIRRIKEWFPDICIIALSGSANRSDIEACISNGASGFISKTVLGHEIVRAVKSIYNSPAGSFDQVTFGVREHGERSKLRLTDREQSVLGLLHRGMTNKEMAKEIGISPETVKIYVKSIGDKLSARNRTDLIVRAMETGLIQSFEN